MLLKGSSTRKKEQEMKVTLTAITLALGLSFAAPGCNKKETKEQEPAKTHKAKPEHARKAHGGHKTPAQARTKPEARVDAPVVFDAPPKIGTRAKCPVMGNVFSVSKDSKRSSYKGKHVAFCCPECKTKFDKKPERYLSKYVKKG